MPNNENGNENVGRRRIIGAIVVAVVVIGLAIVFWPSGNEEVIELAEIKAQLAEMKASVTAPSPLDSSTEESEELEALRTKVGELVTMVEKLTEARSSSENTLKQKVDSLETALSTEKEERAKEKQVLLERIELGAVDTKALRASILRDVLEAQNRALAEKLGKGQDELEQYRRKAEDALARMENCEPQGVRRNDAWHRLRTTHTLEEGEVCFPWRDIVDAYSLSVEDIPEGEECVGVLPIREWWGPFTMGNTERIKFLDPEHKVAAFRGMRITRIEPRDGHNRVQIENYDGKVTTAKVVALEKKGVVFLLKD